MLSSIPKPVFEYNTLHIDHIQNTHTIKVELMSSYKLEEEYSWYFNIGRVSGGSVYITGFNCIHDQFDGDDCFYGIDPNGHDSFSNLLDIPITFRSGTIMEINLKSAFYNQKDTFAIFLIRPNYYGTPIYSERISTITIDTYLDLPDGVCGDDLHPYPRSDLNKDCSVDLLDLMILAQDWLTQTR
jgi:hypothetical protein